MKTVTGMKMSALLIGAGLLSTGALAAPLQDSMLKRTETVQYAVSEASTERGAAALYGQLRAAAERVCREDAVPTFWSDYTREAQTTCMEAALDKAVNRVGLPTVSLLHSQAKPAARQTGFAGE